MARVMICDDDKVMAEELVVALRSAKHEAATCRHTMDVLREAAEGRFDLIVFGLDMHGFGGSSAIEAIYEFAPRLPIIGLHKRPSEIIRTPAHARLAAILPRPVSIDTFMYAVARALEVRLRVTTPPAHSF
jgi:DNA-binding NtrC family response regulator